MAFESVSPVLPVTDVERSIAHYTEKLGFALDFTWEEPPTYGSVQRDGFAIHLARRGDGQSIQRVCLYICVDDVDGYFESCRAAGVRILHEVADQPYGMREFDIEDPDGHVLCFGQSTVC